MIRKLKAIGLALVAALALTAVMASPASAQFTSSKTHTILSGSQTGNHSISAGSGFGAIGCTTVTMSGTATNTNEATWVFLPTFSNCKDSLGRTVDIDNASYIYTFTANTNAGGTSDIHVSGGMTLTVTSGGSVVCTVTITSTQTDNGIGYKNLGGTSGVEIRHFTNNLKSTIEGGFFNCGTATTNATAGTFSGATIVTGKDTSNAAATISVDVA